MSRLNQSHEKEVECFFNLFFYSPKLVWKIISSRQFRENFPVKFFSQVFLICCLNPAPTPSPASEITWTQELPLLCTEYLPIVSFGLGSFFGSCCLVSSILTLTTPAGRVSLTWWCQRSQATLLLTLTSFPQQSVSVFPSVVPLTWSTSYHYTTTSIIIMTLWHMAQLTHTLQLTASSYRNCKPINRECVESFMDESKCLEQCQKHIRPSVYTCDIDDYRMFVGDRL